MRTEIEQGEAPPRAATVPRERRWALALMLAITTCAFIDRAILNTVGQAIRDDLKLSDLQLGLLGGAAFSILYGTLGIPVARWAERSDRIGIVSLAVTIWSSMTMLCAMATGFWQLLLMRIGVGVGEAGANAPVQSYLSDLYPPERRGTVVGILGLSVPLGIIIGGIGGAWVAQHHGWRMAFLLVGLPGLVLAAAARLTLRDKRPPVAKAEIPSLRTVLATLWESRSFRQMIAGGVVTSFIGQAVLAFGHPFFVRNFGLSYTEAAVYFALVNGASVAGGYMVGGFVVDRFVTRDVRYYGWIPALMMLLAGPFYIAGFLQRELLPGLILLAIPGVFSASYYAPVLAVTQNIVASRMRATAISIVLLAMNIIGLLLGPLTAGALSDFYFAQALPAGINAAACRVDMTALCEAASARGVSYALATICLLFLWSAAHYFAASRHLQRDIDFQQQQDGNP
jgi:Arabinose efflux permease